MMQINRNELIEKKGKVKIDYNLLNSLEFEEIDTILELISEIICLTDHKQSDSIE